MIDVSPVQLLNAEAGIVITLSSNMIVVIVLYVGNIVLKFANALSEMLIFLNAVQPENAELPMLVTFVGIVNSISPEQLLNPDAGILATLSSKLIFVIALYVGNIVLKLAIALFGMPMVLNAVQPENAELPMLVTLVGIVISVSPVQLLNPEAGIVVTLPSNMIVVIVLYVGNIVLKFATALFGMLTVLNALQPENADVPMLVTLVGMVISVSPVQLLNPEAGIVVTFSSNIIVVIVL